MVEKGDRDAVALPITFYSWIRFECPDDSSLTRLTRKWPKKYKKCRGLSARRSHWQQMDEMWENNCVSEGVLQSYRCRNVVHCLLESGADAECAIHIYIDIYLYMYFIR